MMEKESGVQAVALGLTLTWDVLKCCYNVLTTDEHQRLTLTWDVLKLVLNRVVCCSKS